MQDERVDVIVVGAGPAGTAAALTLARAGLEVVVIERGAYPGAKNVMGGILYRQPTEELVPEFWREAPLERAIIEQRYMLLTEDSLLGVTYRTQEFAKEPYNSFSVMRGEFDQWFASKAEEAGAFIITQMVVEDLIWEDGKIDGVRTGEEEGDLRADVVVLADGANSLLAQKAGLHREWKPNEQALVAKELIRLSEEEIERRFNVPSGQGVAMEIFGQSTKGLLGYGFIYTNKDTISIGTGALLSDLIETGRNVSDMLNDFKAHPCIAPMLEGGELVEYSAHLIPEGGWHSMPRLFTDGAVVVGDAAGLLNPINREGSNFAMISGKLAAEAIIEAKAAGDFSAVGLSRYQELLEESFVLQDLYTIRNVTPFAHARPWLLNEVPEVLSRAMREYLTVDDDPKRVKQGKILRILRDGFPVGRTLGDAVGALRLLR
ncbi:FAD-dependent oxidoreductase [Sphaerobacter thermophilus]|jgi:electron transfer flavoprotein-quinone oxidoreductase|uniref:FAD-dependent oxidoreductase n=1 Tax=Sphaerobacter thermophilus TaxID=2057 RepID=UPI000DB70FC8|nr:MAG: FAD-dependent oxidoreductase [Sphaerobacter thermophilus]